MRSTFKLAFGLPAFTLFLIVGCQKVNYDRTVQVEPGDVQVVMIDPPRSAQKVSVVASSPGTPVDVYVVLEKDQEEAKQSLLSGKSPAKDKLLANKQKAEEATLEATVPAKNGFAVLVSGAKKSTQVKLKITGR